MARYDYRCTSCNTVFEVEHGMTEHPEITCPDCGASATKVFNVCGIKFTGSGFYNTDERNRPFSGGDSGINSSSRDTGSKAHEGSSSSTSESHTCENCPHKASA